MAQSGGGFYQDNSMGNGRQSLGGNSYGGDDKAKKDWDAQTITHMTCKQAGDISRNSNEEFQTPAGREVHQIAVLGRILAVDEPGTKVKYTLTDATGPLTFTTWLNNNDADSFGDDEGSANSKLTGFVVGKYISAMLRINASQEGGVDFTAQPGGIKLVDDFNEITFHNLKCLHVHLLNNHGSGAGVGAAAHGGVKQEYHPEAKGYGKAVGLGGDKIGLGGVGQGIAAQAAGKAAAGGALSGDELKMAVLEALSTMATQMGKVEDGIHKDEALQYLVKKGYSIEALHFDNALEDLSGDGQIYSTTDDDHYAPTEQDTGDW